MSERPRPTLALALLLAAVTAACSGQGPEAAQTRTTTPIVDGTVANEYPESALLDLYQGGQFSQACSGSLVAPQVVLTAGHCVVGVDEWVVTLPYAHQQRSHATYGEVYDYQATGENVNPDSHDIGLVFLDVPLYLVDWPALASAEVSSGSMVVNIGRIQSGHYSNANLFVSSPVIVSEAGDQGFPFDYAARDTIQNGDSGGPTELVDVSPHVIVAVNSGVGGNTEVLARVDLLAWWIAQEEATHGGQPPGQTVDPGGSGGSGGGQNADQGGSGGSPYWTTHGQQGTGHGCAAAPGMSTGVDALAVATFALLAATLRRRRATYRLEGNLRK
jgi:MYXO-CTERM domain-containing protein